jgi:hypothetical protein
MLGVRGRARWGSEIWGNENGRERGGQSASGRDMCGQTIIVYTGAMVLATEVAISWGGGGVEQASGRI